MVERRRTGGAAPWRSRVGRHGRAGADGPRRGHSLLFSIQHEDGYWCGELGADSTLQSDYILLLPAAGNRGAKTG